MPGKIKFDYDHSYDYFYDKVKDNMFFNQSSWDKAAANGTLDSYIVELNEIGNVIDIEDFEKTYGLEYLNEDQARMAIQNEVYKNNLLNMVKDDAIRFKTDENGENILVNGKPVEEKYETNLYEYNKKLLQEQALLKQNKLLEEYEKNYKDSMGSFAKWLTGAALNVGKFGTSAVKQFEGTLSFLYGLGGGIALSLRDKSNLSDNITELMASDDVRFISKWANERVKESTEYETLDEAIFDLERKISDNRDYEGNFSNFWEAMSSSVWETAGQLAGSAIFSGVAGSLGKSKKAIEFLKTGAFYTGITANTVKDTYDEFAKNGISVSNAEILTNSLIKVGLQIAIEKGLSAILGSTKLDIATKGTTSKKPLIKFNSAGFEFAKQGLQEGLEEVLQELSDGFVDMAYSHLVQENFGELTEITFEGIALSFVTGALMAYGTAGIEVLSTKRIETKDIEVLKGEDIPTYKYDAKKDEKRLDKDDTKIPNQDTKIEIKTNKLSKLQSWYLNMNLQSYVENINKLTDLDLESKTKGTFVKGSKTYKEYVQTVRNAYESVRALSAIYNNVGEEKFNSIMETLNAMNKAWLEETEFVSGYGEKIKNNFSKALDDLETESKNKVLEKLKDAQMKNIAEIYDKDDFDNVIYDDETAKKLANFFKKYKKVVVTKGGTKAVADKDNNVIFVSENQFNNISSDAIMLQVDEDSIVDYVVSNYRDFNIDRTFINNIIELYKNCYGEQPTVERVIFQFLYDDSFRDSVVRTTKNGYTILETIVKNLHKVKGGKNKDASDLNRKLEIVEQLLKITMINYLIDYPKYVEKADLKIFNESQYNFIKQQTFAILACDTYVETSKISDDYKKSLEKRIDNAILKTEQKAALKDILNNKKSTKEQREFLIDVLDERYNYYFKGNKNNIIYLTENGDFKKVLFNNFLKANEITLRDLNKENMQYFSEQFRIFTGNMFDFELTNNINNRVSIFNTDMTTDKRQKFSYYLNSTRDRTIIVRSENKNIIKRYASEDYDNLTIDDLITNKYLLNKTTINSILAKYDLKSIDEISIEHVVNYFNFILKDDDIQVSLDDMGQFCLVDLYEMKKVFSKTRFSLNNLLEALGGFITTKSKVKTTRSKNIKELGLIKNNFLQHFPPNSKLRIVKNDDASLLGEYDSRTDTITLYYRDNLKNNNAFFTFAHEFQHLISNHNLLSKGTTKLVDYLNPKDAVRLIRLLEKYKLIEENNYQNSQLEDAIKNNSFNELYKSEDPVKKYIANVFYNLYRSIQGEVDANSLVNTMLPFYVYVDPQTNQAYLNTPFSETFLLSNNRFQIKDMDKEKGTDNDTNTSHLVSYDIPSDNEHNKPLTERQKKIQENKLKRPVEYKPGKFKVAKVDKDGNIIYTEKGKIDYKYPNNYGSRYVSDKESKGTNLEKYGYNRKELLNDFKSFIVKATPDIDTQLWKKLKEGKLKRQDVLNRIKDGDLDDKTFALINDCFFKNNYIENKEELDTYVELTSQYAALYYTLKNTNLLNEYGDKITKDNIKDVIDIISKDSELSKLYSKYEKRFNEYWKKELDIDKGALRLNWLSMYDGTIFTAGHIANIARKTAVETYFVTNKEVSLESKISGTDLNIEDTLRDDYSQDAYEQILNDMSNSQEFEALKRLIILKSQEAAEKEDANKNEIYTKTKQKLAQLQSIYDNTPEKIHSMFIAQTSKMSTEQKHKLLVGTIIEEQLDRKLKENEEKKLEELSKRFSQKYERSTRNIITNIKHAVTTISNNITKNEKRRFLEKNKDLFHSVNNKIVIREDVYKNKSKEELEQIEERVKELSNEVKAGAWHSVKEYKQFKKMQAEIEKLRNELINEKLKVKREVITINNDDDIIVNTSVKMPSKLKQILDNTFDKTAKTKVQEISLEDSEHITQNYYSFVENNASILNSLTSAEAEEIINFYLSSEVLPETNKVRQYLATRLFVSTFIIKQNEAGIFNISQENIDNLTLSVEKMVSIGAQVPSLWKQSLKAIRDTREMLIKGFGNEMLSITFEKGTIKKLNNAIESGDYEKIKIARKEMYEEGIRKLREEKKLTKKDSKYYLEKFIQFERTMMLSGPGTWVRNQISNIVIGGLRAPTEKLGSATTKVLQKLFPKKFKKEVTGQYKLIGTKVTSEVTSFIKSELIDNDLLKLISLGLNKQTSADIDYNYRVDNIVDLIKQGIKNDLRFKSQYNNKLINETFNFIYKMMSDDKFVNKTMLQYFGKMLTEKNVNLKNGMTNEVIKILVDAYTFAASEYMHKTNLLTKFENWVKGESYAFYFMYKQLLPFAAAGWNWFVEGLNYTPFGLIKSIIQFAKLENTIAKIKDDGKISSEFAQYATIKNIGKGVIGSIGTLVGALLALFGVARIDKEDDKYKLFVGNTAVDISDVFGTQSILISMSIVSAIKDGETLKSVVATAIDTMFEDSTFQDTLNLFRYSDTFSDVLLYLPEKFLRAMIPNFFKQIASIINVKEVKFDTGIAGRIERLAVQSVPGIAYLLPHYIDPYTGEEQIPYNMPLLTNLINKLTPVKIYPYRVSEYEKEATSLGVSKGMLSGEYTINDKDVKLNSSQRKSLNEHYAKLNRADLDELFKNKTKYKVQNNEGTYDELYYKDMTEKQKATIIDRLMSNNSGYAKVYVLTQEMGYKYYTTNAERETLRNLGITKNIFVKNNKYNGYVK